MKKDLAIIAGLFVLIMLIIVFGGGYSSLSFLSSNQPQESTSRKAQTKVAISSLTIDARIAASASLRKKGLSKMDTLPFGEGMLFVFDNPGQYGIWMKDMRFAIDILWIDENKNVVDIAVDVPPEKGKRDRELTVYKPSHDVKYILEINAGLVKLNGIQVGDRTAFEL